jgi:CheY-like chemotaxis protein
MSEHNTARILVADDDLGVIAAYRYVLEGDEYASAMERSATLSGLGNELFGSPREGEGDMPLWRVNFVDQGEDAVKAVAAAIADGDPYSVVFLDIRMPPGLDGYETADQIRKLDPLVNIVFVSGYSDYTLEDLIEVAGPAHKISFLAKPVWPDQLKYAARVTCQDWSRGDIAPNSSTARPLT